MKNSRKVFVAMSGGVDSSVAALLLKKRGYDCAGVFMRSYNLDGCEDRDARDARLVAQKIGIPFYVWDFEKEYKKKVVDYMVDGYRRGITPNPDVMCNKEIKFGLFLEKALKLGADYIATGHYARLTSTNSESITNLRISDYKSHSQIRDKIRYSLMAARDTNKDQSYFLCTLTQKQLRHCLFPVGDYLKPEVRTLAKKAGLPTAEKKDSQGICFLGKVSLADFLKKRIRSKSGLVLNIAGKAVGKHDGSCFYTIGQRHGLGIAAPRPLYIAEKNIKKNLLVMAEGKNNPALYKKEIFLKNINFINYGLGFKNRKLNIPVLARVRYRQPLGKAVLSRLGNVRLKLVFVNPQKFVAPGQSAVFYSNKGEMLGGGVIL